MAVNAIFELLTTPLMNVKGVYVVWRAFLKVWKNVLFHLHILKAEAALSFKTLGNLHQNALHNFEEDVNFGNISCILYHTKSPT